VSPTVSLPGKSHGYTRADDAVRGASVPMSDGQDENGGLEFRPSLGECSGMARRLGPADRYAVPDENPQRVTRGDPRPVAPAHKKDDDCTTAVDSWIEPSELTRLAQSSRNRLGRHAPKERKLVARSIGAPPTR
jgi:hypothetical protein